MNKPTMTTRLTFAALIAAASLSACKSGDDAPEYPDAPMVNCATETRADPYTAGMEVYGNAGYKVVLMSSDPAPPAKGDNDWQLQVMDSTGATVDGATLKLTPFMPDHGHGTSIKAVVTPAGSNGEYEATPVNLWMPGYWEVTVDIDDQGTTDTAVFKVCIDG